LLKLSSFLNRILPENLTFQGGERLILFQNDLFSWVEVTHVSHKRKESMLEAEACSTLFPCENWVSFWKEYCLQSGFSTLRNSYFVSNRAILLSWRTHVSLRTKPFVLEAGAYSTFFPCETLVWFWKEYWLPIRVSKGKICTFYSK
jgi:hypothetical protein